VYAGDVRREKQNREERERLGGYAMAW